MLRCSFLKQLLLRCFDCSNFLCANCVMAHQVSIPCQFTSVCRKCNKYAGLSNKFQLIYQIVRELLSTYVYLYFQFMHCFEGHHVSTLGEITSNSGGHHVQVKKKMKTMILNIAKGTTLNFEKSHHCTCAITCKQRTSTFVLFDTFVTIR